MKKGFTLIELLAVIVILAIIALIATPIVLSIIEETKESAVLRSAEHYLSGVEQSIMKKNLTEYFSPTECEIQIDGNLLCDGRETLEVELSGEVPSSGNISFEKGKISTVELTLAEKELIMYPSRELEYKLAPGLYDENNKLLLSWEELVAQYNMDTLIIEGDISEEVDSPYRGEVGLVIDSIKGAGKLVIDESVTKIGDYAFGESTSSLEIIIPNSVTSIGEWSFYQSNLKSIIISSSVTSIGVTAFSGCPNLTNIIVDKNNPKYDSRNNSNALIETATNTLIVGSNSTVIPDSVTRIGDGAFEGHSGPASITIPGSVISIGSGAFVGCRSLKNVIIENGVTSIGYMTFSNTGLTSITIPSSVTSIGENAFENSNNLKTIYYKGTATGASWGATNATVITDF